MLSELVLPYLSSFLHVLPALLLRKERIEQNKQIDSAKSSACLRKHSRKERTERKEWKIDTNLLINNMKPIQRVRRYFCCRNGFTERYIGFLPRFQRFKRVIFPNYATESPSSLDSEDRWNRSIRDTSLAVLSLPEKIIISIARFVSLSLSPLLDHSARRRISVDRSGQK